MPKVNIKKFSRSKVDEIQEEDSPIIKQQPIKKIKNKKEVRIIEPEPEPEPIEFNEPEEEPEDYFYNPEEEDCSFLQELNNTNYKEEVKEDNKPKKESLTDSGRIVNTSIC